MWYSIWYCLLSLWQDYLIEGKKTVYEKVPASDNQISLLHNGDVTEKLEPVFCVRWVSTTRFKYNG